MACGASTTASLHPTQRRLASSEETCPQIAGSPDPAVRGGMGGRRWQVCALGAAAAHRRRVAHAVRAGGGAPLPLPRGALPPHRRTLCLPRQVGAHADGAPRPQAGGELTPCITPRAAGSYRRGWGIR
eukprot:733141-Prorocentrum_minimum.AAC.2